VSDTSIPTRRASASDSLLQEKLVEEISQQPARLDELAQKLIALELAIPGIYVAALKLMQAYPQTQVLVWPLAVTIIFWFMALLLAFVSLFPKTYQVDPNLLRRHESANHEQPLSIEAFFSRSAAYKRRLLAVSCFLFFAGIVSADFSVL